MAPTEHDGRPPLSVVVTDTGGWEQARACLERLLPQLAAVGGELVLAGTGDPATAPPAPGCAVAVVGRPGASPFDLRVAGLAQARGEVVAITEEHCLPDEGWCAAILAAHAEQPRAEAIGGAVVNGSAGSRVDWANFLLTFAEFLPPAPGGGLRVPPTANVSLKRRVLPAAAPRPGWLETELLPALQRAGRTGFDPRPRVAHVQPRTLWTALRAHFDNGRATTGLAPSQSVAPARRAAAAARLPLRLLSETRAALAARPPLPAPARGALPLVALLAFAHAAGELAGAVAGPGRSPARLD